MILYVFLFVIESHLNKVVVSLFSLIKGGGLCRLVKTKNFKTTNCCNIIIISLYFKVIHKSLKKIYTSMV